MRHPELAAAKSNRDFVLQQVTDAVNTISGVAQATGQSEPNPYEGAGELASALNEFDVRIDCRVNNVFECLVSKKIFGCFSKQQKIIMEPMSYNEVRTRPSLQERLESIISGAALLADSSCTRDDRRERIIQECNAVRSALQDLLNEYMNNVSVLTLLLFSLNPYFENIDRFIFFAPSVLKSMCCTLTEIGKFGFVLVSLCLAILRTSSLL